jgi:hypothetical protein
VGIPYITDMISTDLEPDFPTAEQLEACAKEAREGTALWVWGDDYFENVLLWMQIWAEAKEDVMRKEPWTRQYLDTIS